MGIEKLAQAAVILAMAAAAAGQLPRLVREVQIAQFKLLKDSQSSKWPKAMLLKDGKTKTTTKHVRYD